MSNTDYQIGSSGKKKELHTYQFSYDAKTLKIEDPVQDILLTFLRNNAIDTNSGFSIHSSQEDKNATIVRPVESTWIFNSTCELNNLHEIIEKKYGSTLSYVISEVKDNDPYIAYLRSAKLNPLDEELAKALKALSEENQKPKINTKPYFKAFVFAFMTILALFGVNQTAWADWYIVGNLPGTSWDNAPTGGKMSDKVKVFKNTAAGTYYFRLSNGSNQSGGQCVNESNITVDINNDKAMYFTTTETKDLYFEVTDESNWKIAMYAFDASTYYIKHPWNGGSWTWQQMTSNGNGTYYFKGKYGNNGCNWRLGGGNSQWISNPTKIGNPETGDNCTFTLNPTASTIEILKFAVPDDLKLDGPLGNGWNSCQNTTKSGNVFTYTINNKSAGTYKFCFKNNNCDAAALVKPNMSNVQIGTCTNCTLVDDNTENHNFEITTNATGTVTVVVTYNTSTEKIIVTATAPSSCTAPAGGTISGTTSYNVGDEISLTANVTAGNNLSYQWKKDGNALSGKTSQTLTISSCTASDAGSYTCDISNTCGNTTTTAASVTVSTPTYKPGYLVYSLSGSSDWAGHTSTTEVGDYMTVTIYGTSLKDKTYFAFTIATTSGWDKDKQYNVTPDTEITIDGSTGVVSTLGAANAFYIKTSNKDNYKYTFKFNIYDKKVYVTSTLIQTVVTFDKNDGSGDKYNVNVTYQSRDRIVVPNTSDTTRTGYTFNHYWKQTTGSTATDQMTSIINTNQLYFINSNRDGYLTSGKWTKDGGTATFYAHWTPKEYTVVLPGGGGTGDINGSVKVKYDAASTVDNSFKAPTKLGYSLKTPTAFFANAEFTQPVFTAIGALSTAAGNPYVTSGKWNYDGSPTIYTQWTANTYTMALDGQSPTTAGSTSVTLTYDASAISITLPKKEGYTFDGYYTSKDGGGTQFIDGNGALVANVTYNEIVYTNADSQWKYDGNGPQLYAKWTAKDYTVTLNQTDATTTGTTSISTTYNEVPTNVASLPSRTGYIFDGYKTQTSPAVKLINANGTWVSDISGFTDANGKWVKDDNVTLDPIWIAKTFTIRAHNNYGDEDNVVSFTATYGNVLGNPTSFPHTRTGYELRNYYLVNSATDNLTITNQAASSWATGRTADNTPEPYKVNWTDANKKWAYNGDCAAVEGEGAGPIDIYANWAPKSYTIRLYNTAESTTDKTVKYDVIPSKVAIPQNGDNVFAGYYTTNEYTTQIINDQGYFNANVQNYTGDGGVWQRDIEAELTFYAKWVEPTYQKVHFGITNGTEEVPSGRGTITAQYNNGTAESPDWKNITSGATEVMSGKAIKIVWDNSTPKGQYYTGNQAYKTDGWYPNPDISSVAPIKTGTGKTFETTIGVTDIYAYVNAIDVLYDVTVGDADHGSAVALPTQAGPNVASIVTATGDTGYELDYWTLSDGSKSKFVNSTDEHSNPTQIAAIDAITITPTFKETTYEVTVQNQWGTTVTPVGDHPIQVGQITEVEVTATPPFAGFVFKQWTATGGVEIISQSVVDEKNKVSIKATGIGTITAEYEQPTLSIKGAAKSWGYEDVEITPTVTNYSGTAHICYTSSDAEASSFTAGAENKVIFAANKMQTYTITATLRSSDDCNSGEVFATSAAISIEFAHRYQLVIDGLDNTTFTYEKTDGTADIVKNITDLTSGTDYTATVKDLKTGEASGASANFKYTLAGNYTFHLALNPLGLTVPSVPTAYSIQAIAGSNVTEVSPSTVVWVEPNAVQSISASVKPGYNFAGWVASPEANAEIASAASLETTATVKGNVQITANASAQNFAINYTDAQSVANITTKPLNANTDAQVTMTIVMKTGFKNLSVVAKDASDNNITLNKDGNNYTFTMPASAVNVTITATALPIVYVLKSKGAQSTLEFTSPGTASQIKFWGWSLADGTPNFYSGADWNNKPTAESKATVYTDAIGNEWYAFVPENTSKFDNTTHYRVRLWSNSNEIYNEEDTHWKDDVSVGSKTHENTGTIWIVPRGDVAGAGRMYTTYPDKAAITTTVTLHANYSGGVDGSATIATTATTTTTFSAVGERAGYLLNGYYTLSEGGDKVMEANGTLVNAAGYVEDGKWVKMTTTADLYAQWSPLTVYFINSEKWPTVKYYDTDDQTTDKWPGSDMTYVGQVVISGRTFNYYSANVVAGHTIIFNNGASDATKKQTANLSVDGNYGKYFMADTCFVAKQTPTAADKPDGAWYNTLEAAQEHGLDCITDVFVTFESKGNGGLTAKAGDDDITTGALVAKGSNLVFTAAPDANYTLEGFFWNSDCPDSTRYAGASASALNINNVQKDTKVYARFDRYYNVNVEVASGQSAMGYTKPANVISQVGAISVRSVEAFSNDKQLYQFDKWTLMIGSEEKSDWTGKDGKTYGITLHDSCTVNNPTIRINATENDRKLIANFKARDVVTIYFVNSSDWTDVHVHLWAGNIDGTTWPGVIPNKLDRKVNGHDVYSYTFDNGNYTKAQWNCGKNSCQTVNITIDKNNPVYNYKDMKLYPSLDAVLPDPYENTTWRIKFDDEAKLLNYDNGSIWYCDLENVPVWTKTGDNWLKLQEYVSNNWQWRGIDKVNGEATTDNHKIENYASTTMTVSTGDGKQVNLAGHDKVANLTLTFDQTNMTLTVGFTQPMAILTVSATEWDVDSETPLVLRAYAKNATDACTYQFEYSTDGTNWTSLGAASANNVMEITKDKLASVPATLGTYQFKVTLNTTYDSKPFSTSTTKNVDLYKYYWLALKEKDSGNNWCKNIYVKRNGVSELSAYPGEVLTEKQGDFHFYKFQYPTYDYLKWNDGVKSGGSGSNDMAFNPNELCHEITGSSGTTWSINTNGTCPQRIYINFVNNTYYTSLDGSITLKPSSVKYYGTDKLTYTWSITEGNNVQLSSEHEESVSITPLAIGDATVKLSITDNSGNESYYYCYIKVRNGFTIRVFNTYGLEFASKDWWVPNIRVWEPGKSATDYTMNNEGNGWYSYVETTRSKINFVVSKSSSSIGTADQQTVDVQNVDYSGCWIVSTDVDSESKKHKMTKTDDCGLYYRIESVTENGTFKSNKVTKAGDDLSFYATTTGQLNLLHYDEAAKDYVKIATLSDTLQDKPEEDYVQTAKFTGKGISNVEKYTGDYWLRTNIFKDWNTYLDDNHKFTEFTRNPRFPNEAFNFYFVKHCNKNTLVTGQVANAINDNLATFIKADDFTDANGYIPEEGGGNVRFGYCPETNYFTRDIINGSSSAHFAEVYGDNSTYFNGGQNNSTLYTSSTLTDANKIWRDGDDNHSQLFTDMSNWVYQTTVYATIDNARIADTKAVIAAKYNGKWKYLLGYDEVKKCPTYACNVLGATSTKNITYEITLIYDFKTNRLVTAWTPSTMTIDQSMEVDADVMFLRHENRDVAQITIANTDVKVNNLNSVVFCLEFDRDTLTDQEGHYWFSLPFDCKLQDIYGVEGYMDVWGIQRYNGEKRSHGWYKDDDATFWTWVDKNETLNRGEGYVLHFDKARAKALKLWKEITIGGITKSILRIYFPSKDQNFTMSLTDSKALEITYPNQQCTIQGRTAIDSNWKLLGMTSYNNIKINTMQHTDTAQFSKDPAKFLYIIHDDWTKEGRTYGKYELIDASKNFTYRSFNSYMTQFAGTIQWQQFTQAELDNTVAARRVVNENEIQSANLHLSMTKAGALQDYTYIKLLPNATTGYDRNLDLVKIRNSKYMQLYSMSEGDPYAGNSLPVEDQIVPLAVNLTTAGEYTFAMPDGTDGAEVYLVDNVAKTHTDLSLGGYTVNLDAGLYDSRFSLEIKVKKLPSSIEMIDANGDKLIKFIRNEKMFILRDGKIYNATGSVVE